MPKTKEQQLKEAIENKDWEKVDALYKGVLVPKAKPKPKPKSKPKVVVKHPKVPIIQEVVTDFTPLVFNQNYLANSHGDGLAANGESKKMMRRESINKNKFVNKFKDNIIDRKTLTLDKKLRNKDFSYDPRPAVKRLSVACASCNRKAIISPGDLSISINDNGDQQIYKCERCIGNGR